MQFFLFRNKTGKFALISFLTVLTLSKENEKNAKRNGKKKPTRARKKIRNKQEVTLRIRTPSYGITKSKTVKVRSREKIKISYEDRENAAVNEIISLNNAEAALIKVEENT